MKVQGFSFVPLYSEPMEESAIQLVSIAGAYNCALASTSVL